MKKILTAFALLLLASAPSFAADAKNMIIGVTPFPHKDLVLIAKPLLEKEGYTVTIKEFSDYVTPDMALADGSLTANFYQHIPYLDDMNAKRGLGLVWVAKVHLEPIGIYSKKITKLDELKEGDTIAVPNDPSNGARALRLLEKAGLFKFKAGELITAKDLVENPKGLKLKEIEAALLPRTLPDVTAAVINTNFASEAGLVPSKDAIMLEDKDSPYANIVVVRGKDKDTAMTKDLVKAMNSPEIKEYIIRELEPKGILPAF